jgi:hypothetical protein
MRIFVKLVEALVFGLLIFILRAAAAACVVWFTLFHKRSARRVDSAGARQANTNDPARPT